MSDNGHRPTLVERALTPVVERAIDARREQIASELIGRYVLGEAQLSVFRSRARVVTIDETVPDYEFYDLLRRGKAKGYSLGGLFCTRIEKIFASWVLGNGVEVALVESGDPDNENDTRNITDGRIADFLEDNHATCCPASAKNESARLNSKCTNSLCNSLFLVGHVIVLFFHSA